MIALRINVASFIDGYANTVAFLRRTVPLDFPPLNEIGAMVGQTLAIVVLGTALSYVLSVPVALLAAQNTTINKITRIGGRVLTVGARALPELIIAMFFLRVFGLGALPGILALGLHSVGMVAKLFTDAIEELDPGPREALRATGATGLQQITGAILPELRPAMVATVLHRFDINLRGSVILGFVGVGGIGLELASALNTMNYPRGLAITVILLVLCLGTELLSGIIRTALLGHTRDRRRSPINRAVAALTARIRNPIPGTPQAPRTRTHRGRAATPDLTRISPPWDRARVGRTIWIAVAIAVGVASLIGADIDLGQVRDGLGKGLYALGLYLPPGTGGIADKLAFSMLETVQMALAGTLLGLVLAIPVGVLAARNVAPTPRIAAGFRVLIVCIRSIPGLVIGICFVVITGLGAAAGALALAIGAIGFLSKIIADSIEETDVRVQQALRAGGADRGQVFIAATLRQSASAVVSHILHNFDNDIRAATSLGVIGAGGIGYYMVNANRVMQFDVVTTCMLMILVTILAVEALSIWTRREVR